MAQSVKHLTLGFGSGHDLTVCGIKPHVGLPADSVDPTWNSLSPSLSDPPPAHTLSLKINKLKKNWTKGLIGHFTKGDVNTNIPMKKYPT